MNGLNPQFAVIGTTFVESFYPMFDSLTFKTDENAKRQLLSFYHENAMLSFEGSQIQGNENIVAKFISLPFKSLTRVVTTVDSQPIADGGVAIMVVGQLKTDDDSPHPFSHVFILRPNSGSFHICHEFFRLGLHNI
ncbi:probable nuclear transport factor 2 [Liolophura sinensis]|uniref:probable nuclear transport factor 2 n=1 Tax=Liolophura sinensis TaxID=3198878 RepID=UPI003158F954